MSNNNPKFEKRNTIWIILAIINLVLIFVLISDQKRNVSNNGNEKLSPSTVVSSNTPEIVQTIDIKDTFTPDPVISETTISEDLMIILSMHVDQKSRLYLFKPKQALFISLFNDPYERIHPSLNESQEKLAYSAKKNGYWDIYILDLKTGEEIQVTDTPEYDGSPSWSPDHQYLAYESYQNGNLDIFIQNINDLSVPPFELTNDESAQFSPAWSPKGDVIAFVSTQNGDEEIYLATLDTIENRFAQFTDRPNLIDLNPEWSPNGEKLFWSSEKNGYPIILNSTVFEKNNSISEVGVGSDIGSSKNEISYIQSEANQNFLIIKNISTNQLLFPSFKLPGNTYGIVHLTSYNDNEFLKNSYEQNPSIDTRIAYDQNTKSRNELVKVDDVEIDSHFLHENAIGPFNQFRSIISEKTGWDFLYQLDKTYTPLTEPSVPGMIEEWLFTGRAFEFNPLSTHAGLVLTIKEERNGQTYWRILIKTRYQDGSQGMPIRQMPFDLAARYNNDPLTYETGGRKISIPDGYWVDVTEIAQSLRWERVPALGNWQRFFEATRFNQFVFTDGMDWQTAMSQIYPVEALRTPSPLPTNSLTPTSSPTIRYFRSPTISITPTVPLAPTYRPTWTPYP